MRKQVYSSAGLTLTNYETPIEEETRYIHRLYYTHGSAKGHYNILGQNNQQTSQKPDPSRLGLSVA